MDRLREKTLATFNRHVGEGEGHAYLEASAEYERQNESKPFVDSRFYAWQYCRKQAQWLDGYIIRNYGPETGFGAGFAVIRPDGAPRIN